MSKVSKLLADLQLISDSVINGPQLKEFLLDRMGSSLFNGFDKYFLKRYEADKTWAETYKDLKALKEAEEYKKQALDIWRKIKQGKDFPIKEKDGIYKIVAYTVSFLVEDGKDTRFTGELYAYLQGIFENQLYYDIKGKYDVSKIVSQIKSKLKKPNLGEFTDFEISLGKDFKMEVSYFIDEDKKDETKVTFFYKNEVVKLLFADTGKTLVKVIKQLEDFFSKIQKS